MVWGKFRIRIYSKADNYTAFISLKGHTSYIRDIASVGVDSLVSGSDDKTVRVWSIAQQKPVAQFACKDYVLRVAFFE